jgi:hypothetical protein
VVGHLLMADLPVHQLSADGNVAVTLAAARIVAMSFSSDDKNLLWSNPQISDAELVKNTPQKLVGGIGGDRLWFSPELSFFWDGKPDWQTFGNYRIPPAADPGSYEVIAHDERSITLRASGELAVHGSDRLVGFTVDRTIRMTEPPLLRSDALMHGVDYVGVEELQVLRVAKSSGGDPIDLWYLLQVPAGSMLILPLRKEAVSAQKQPLSYGQPGAWVESSKFILWRYAGEARAKFGVSASALTGRSAVLRKLEAGRWCLIVRQFKVDPNGKYADHPYGLPRDDQAFQAWDGYGFGEMEYHSPTLEPSSGAHDLKDTNQLWAFGGSSQAIAALGSRLLGVNVADIMKLQ